MIFCQKRKTKNSKKKTFRSSSTQAPQDKTTKWWLWTLNRSIAWSTTKPK